MNTITTTKKNKPIRVFRFSELNVLLRKEKRESKSIMDDIEEAKAHNKKMERRGKGNKKAAYKAVIQQKHPGEWTAKDDADFDKEYDDIVENSWDNALENLAKKDKRIKVLTRKGGKRRLSKTRSKRRSKRRDRSTQRYKKR
jgi:hypothetical protein